MLRKEFTDVNKTKTKQKTYIEQDVPDVNKNLSNRFTRCKQTECQGSKIFQSLLKLVK